MEGVLVLATIGQRCRLGYVGATAPEIDPKITLRPRDGMPMRIEPR